MNCTQRKLTEMIPWRVTFLLVKLGWHLNGGPHKGEKFWKSLKFYSLTPVDQIQWNLTGMVYVSSALRFEKKLWWCNGQGSHKGEKFEAIKI